MRDKKFIIDSIKMDLYRVVTAVGDVTKPIPEKSVKDFLNHADKDFEKTVLTTNEFVLGKQLQDLMGMVDRLSDPLTRLRWTEDILTIRCRL